MLAMTAWALSSKKVRKSPDKQPPSFDGVGVFSSPGFQTSPVLSPPVPPLNTTDAVASSVFTPGDAPWAKVPESDVIASAEELNAALETLKAEDPQAYVEAEAEQVAPASASSGTAPPPQPQETKFEKLLKRLPNWSRIQSAVQVLSTVAQGYTAERTLQRAGEGPHAPQPPADEVEEPFVDADAEFAADAGNALPSCA